MDRGELHVVTGAFSYTGKYITRRLLAEGVRMRTLTGHPTRAHAFGDAVDIRPLNFDQPRQLEESLRGAAVLYNTYWIRFERGSSTFGRAVQNTRALISAARAVGVGRIVHVSIANATSAPHLPYYAGKAAIERTILESGLPHAIVRPTVIFGLEDILINNIAWILRRLPVFGVPGDGSYGMRPIFVEDMAKLVVGLGGTAGNVTVDAVGPETFTFNAWLRLIARSVGRDSRMIHMPPAVALWASRAISLAVRDTVLTSDEVKGLMANLLVTAGPATGNTRLSDWLQDNAQHVGKEYASEVGRHFR